MITRVADKKDGNFSPVNDNEVDECSAPYSTGCSTSFQLNEILAAPVVACTPRGRNGVCTLDSSHLPVARAATHLHRTTINFVNPAPIGLGLSAFVSVQRYPPKFQEKFRERSAFSRPNIPVSDRAHANLAGFSRNWTSGLACTRKTRAAHTLKKKTCPKFSVGLHYLCRKWRELCCTALTRLLQASTPSTGHLGSERDRVGTNQNTQSEYLGIFAPRSQLRRAL